MLTPSDSLRSRSFLAFVATQFLGAFNDNVFKQMMLLLSVGAAVGANGEAGADQQGQVMIVFTLPFLLFSGYAGQLSERYAKSSVMRLAKLGELFIMLGGFLGFYFNNMNLLLVVLFMMGTQSAFFGPAKYGIIPEMVTDRSLVSANGMVQMTTIVSITLGIALGGFLAETYEGRLHLAAVYSILIAGAGIAVVYAIVGSKANRPEMKLDRRPFGRLILSFKEIFADRALLLALVAYTFFYFSGALVTTTVNNYGRNLLNLGETATSLLLVSLSLGIMLGSAFTNSVRKRISGKWTIFVGAAGVSLTEGLLFFHQLPLGMIHGLLFLAGAFSALYFVPIAAFMQQRPPLGRKGEILAAVNFSNFAGILLAALLWAVFMKFSLSAHFVWLFLAAALAVLLAVMFPQLRKLEMS